MVNYVKPLVSIITPCYNGEKYLPLFLNSILEQTYDNIELIFINDGSIDNTDAIAQTYIPRFQEKGYNFFYINQKNAGQASAVNEGLKIFAGKYLTWPDSDDRLHKEYIEKKVEYLEANPDKSMVISRVMVLHEADLETPIEILERKKYIKDDLLKDFIKLKNCFYPPGGYMVRTDSFLNVVPSKQIINSRQGQNIQLLFPFAYLQNYGYIDDILYDYIIHETSHSHKERSYVETLKRVIEISNLQKDVLGQIPDKNKRIDKAIILIDKELWRRKFYIAKEYQQENDLKIAFLKLVKLRYISLHDFFVYIKVNIGNRGDKK